MYVGTISKDSSELLIKYSHTKNILEQTTLRFSKIILDQASQRVLQGEEVSTDKFFYFTLDQNNYFLDNIYSVQNLATSLRNWYLNPQFLQPKMYKP